MLRKFVISSANRHLGGMICAPSSTPLGVGHQMMRQVKTSSMLREIFHVKSAEDFDRKVKKSDKPVIVDFHATWCSPCQMLTPRLESIVGEMEGAVKLAKVDIDEFTDLALDYDVGAVPLLIVINKGKPGKRMVGLQNMDKIRQWIEESVADEK